MQAWSARALTQRWVVRRGLVGGKCGCEKGWKGRSQGEDGSESWSFCVHSRTSLQLPPSFPHASPLIPTHQARAAEGSNTSVLRDTVLLKPGSTTEDVFQVREERSCKPRALRYFAELAAVPPAWLHRSLPKSFSPPIVSRPPSPLLAPHSPFSRRPLLSRR